jgi:sortase (surface protein transpeptidase)
VSAADASIEVPTTDTRLTLYTCTPLWNPQNRLVVIATPKEKP